jgi:DNA-binding transcriptional LysR family regulator
MWSECELREVRVFLAVAQELHFGRAADRLQITPSYVSQIVRALEARIGGRLFDRTSRRVALTPLGSRLAGNVKPGLEQLEQAFRDARDAANGVTGTVRIGIYLRLNCGPHWHQIARAFRTRHPDCRIEVVDLGLERNYLDALRQHEVDMLATRLPVSDTDLTVGPILSCEERVLLVASDDPLATRDSVGFDDLGDRAVPDAPGFPREMMDAFVPPITPSGRKVQRRYLHTFEEALSLVAAGEIVHVTAASFTDNFVTSGAIVAVPVRDLPASQTGLVWLKASHSTKIEAFVSAAASVLGHTELAAHQPVGGAGGTR